MQKPRWWLPFWGYKQLSSIVSIVDPWAGCSSDLYIWKFRPKIQEIAQEISSLKMLIFARFNLESKCVEIHSGSVTLVQVLMWGEVGLPYATIITPVSIEEGLLSQLCSLFEEKCFPGVRLAQAA